MSIDQLIVRCIAEKKGDQWQALCLDFTLAAQGDTFDEAKQKLEDMICDYVSEAFGEDREFADQLLNRRAPLRDWAKYYYFCLQYRLGRFQNEIHRLFNEALPLKPDSRCRQV